MNNYEFVWVDATTPDKLYHVSFNTETDEKALHFANEVIKMKKLKGQQVELSYVHRRRGWGILESACLTPHNRIKDNVKV